MEKDKTALRGGFVVLAKTRKHTIMGLMYKFVKMHRKWIFVVIAVVFAAGGAFFLVDGWQDFLVSRIGGTKMTVEENLNDSADVVGQGGTIELIPINDPEVAPPEIRKPIVFPKDTPKAVEEDVRMQFEEVYRTLESDHLNVSQWTELGNLRKLVGDYEGAIEAWEYGLLLSPKSMVLHTNIAGVYGYFLRDYTLAEKYYRLAIEHSPSSLQAYGQAYEFFSGVLKDQEKATGIIELGLEHNPNSPELNQFYEQITK